jgi:hypothetical protein
MSCQQSWKENWQVKEEAVMMDCQTLQLIYSQETLIMWVDS